MHTPLSWLPPSFTSQNPLNKCSSTVHTGWVPLGSWVDVRNGYQPLDAHERTLGWDALNQFPYKAQLALD